MKSETIEIIIIAIIVFGFISNFNRFIAMIFVLNFSTSGLNITAITSLLFVLPAIFYYLIEKGNFGSKKYNLILTILLIVLTAGSLFLTAFLKSVISAINLVILNLLLIERTRLGFETFLQGISLGLILNISLSLILIGLTPFATLFGLIMMFLLLGILSITVFLSKERLDEEPKYGMYILTVIMLTYAVLMISNPFIVGTWTFSSELNLISVLSDNPVNGNLYSGLLGITAIIGISIYINLIQGRQFSRIIWYLIVTLTALSLIYYPIATFMIYPLHLIGLLAVIQISAHSPTRKFGLKPLGVLFLLLLFAFFHTLSGHWAFLPSAIHSITKGMAGLYMILILVYLIISAEVFFRRIENE